MENIDVGIIGALCTFGGVAIGAVLNFILNRKKNRDNKYIALNEQTIELTQTLQKNLSEQVTRLARENEKLTASVLTLTRENEKLRTTQESLQDENRLLKLNIDHLESRLAQLEDSLKNCAEDCTLRPRIIGQS